jgi:D-arabinose 1-dehydrogenase-like Zn-dependent alcohol dehydrogenase
MCLYEYICVNINIDGVLCLVGLPESMKYSPAKLIFRRLSVTGSPISSNKEVREMLEFCAKHNIIVCALYYCPVYSINLPLGFINRMI